MQRGMSVGNTVAVGKALGAGEAADATGLDDGETLGAVDGDVVRTHPPSTGAQRTARLTARTINKAPRRRIETVRRAAACACNVLGQRR